MAAEPEKGARRYNMVIIHEGGIIQNRQFAGLALFMQILFIVLFAVLAEYSGSSKPPPKRSKDAKPSELDHYYPMFQDVHVMIFIGFGFLMTFLKRYGFSAVGINFLLAAFILQWAMLLRGIVEIIKHGTAKFEIGTEQLLTADFSAAVVLISMGALLGKLSPIEYLIMGFIETILAVINEHIIFSIFKVNDVGGSMAVHAFGAYFGLAVARILNRNGVHDNPKEGSLYHSDIFSMIGKVEVVCAFLGTVFLWVYWPSFNAAVASPGDARERAVINTYLSLCACCVVSFIVSTLVDARGRFTMVHIQNATLAGGVAIGTTANLALQPFGALLIGFGAAVLSVIGFRYLTPLLAAKCGVHDTCGVNNLHGMPGLLAGLIGVVCAAVSSKEIYGDSIGDLFPGMGPAPDGEDRPGGPQAAYQLAALGVTLGISVVGGVLTGLILKLRLWNKVGDISLFDDARYWEVADDFDVDQIEYIDADDKYTTELQNLSKNGN